MYVYETAMNKEEKLNELAELTEQIRKEEEHANELQDEINSKTQLLINQNLKILEAKTKKNEMIFSIRKMPQFDIKQLPEGYIDHIQDLKDELTKLELDFQTSDENVNNRTIEINNLISKKSELTFKLLKTNAEIFDQELENYPLKSTISLYQEDIKQFNTLIKEAEQIKKKTENSLSQAIKKIDNHDLAAGGLIDLQNKIANAKEQMRMIDEKMQRGLELIDKYQANEMNDEQKYESEMSKFKTLYSFNDQNNFGNRELQGLRENISMSQKQLQQIADEVARKEKRYNYLQPLTLKFKKSKVLSTQIPEEVNIDTMIQKNDSLANKNQIKKIKNTNMLEAIIKENILLANKIEHKQREYNFLLQKLQTEKRTINAQIEQTRSSNSVKEYEILSKIKNTEIKLHENSMKTPKGSVKQSKLGHTPKISNSPYTRFTPNRRTKTYSEM